MKFLVDAQLPRRLAMQLNAAGHDAVHTLSLPQKNCTKDGVINQISIDEQRVVITKDVDFRDSHLVQGQPFKLLLIATGNIRNDELLVLIERNLSTIVTAFESHSYLELDRNHLTIHQ